MRITISGLPGSGTTTVARILSKELNMELISAGEIFREMAKEKKLSLEEFNRHAENNEDIDRWIDKKQKEEAMKSEDVIVEGRLSGFFLTSAELKVWLKASLEIRARRIARRGNKKYEEALLTMKSREISEYKRYRKYYGVDLNNLSTYNLVIDSSRTKEKDVAEAIKIVAKCLCSPTNSSLNLSTS